MKILKREDILAKVKAKKKLTKKEEIFYLVEIVGFTKQEAKRILAIANNKNPNILLD